MEKKSSKKIIYSIIAILLSCAIGFFIGRATIHESNPTVVTKYIKGDVIIDSIYSPIQIEIEKPADTLKIIEACIENGIYYELFPEKIEYIEIEPDNSDTLGIIQDWATKRKYSEKLFDSDTAGFCYVGAEVQYNRLMNLTYSYSNVVKEIVKKESEIKVFSPFISIGMITSLNKDFNSLSVEANGGLYFYERYGIGIKYQYDFMNKNNLIGTSFMLKF